MKKMRKTLALLLTLIMALTLVIACGEAEDNQAAPGTGADTGQAATDPADPAGTAPENEETMVISIVNWDIGISFSDEDDEMRIFFEEKFNIEIDPWNVTWADAGELIPLWAAAGDLPDVIGGVALLEGPTFFQWVSDGVVRSLFEDLSPYPNLERIMRQPSVAVFQVDGRDYMIPRMSYEDITYWPMERGLISRRDWRENLGLPIPVTEQDFIDLLVAFQTGDPDGNGIVDTTGLANTDPWLLYSQVWAGHGFTDARWNWNEDGTAVVMAALEETSIPLLSFFRRLNREGGLDPDFALYGLMDAQNAFAAGKVGMLNAQNHPGRMETVRRAWEEFPENPPFLEAVEILRPPLYPGKEFMAFVLPPFWSETYINASVDDVKLHRILQMFDWMFSEEGMMFSRFGREGMQWEWDGDDIRFLTEINPDTGQPFTPMSLYPFLNGGMRTLAGWGRSMTYIDPGSPPELLAMLREEKVYRENNWTFPRVDLRLLTIDVPEIAMMTIDVPHEWVRFITDLSDTSDRDLFFSLRAEWLANGYQAAKDALTAAAIARGYTRDNMIY